MDAFSLSGGATAQPPLRFLHEARTLSHQIPRAAGVGCNQKALATTFRSRGVTLTLTLGGLWGPTPSLLPLFALSFQGPQTRCGTLHPHPRASLQRQGTVSPLTSGAEVEGPLPDAGGRPRRRRQARAASPASPRKPQRRPAPPRLPAPRLRSRGPGIRKAMARPETGPATSSGRIRAAPGLWAGRGGCGFLLPASGSAVSHST
nr:small integral membrane protein 15 isoform X2 [Equus asinus]